VDAILLVSRCRCCAAIGSHRSIPLRPKEIFTMRQVQTFILGAAAIAVLSLSVAAPAHADWRWRHGSHGWVRFWYAPGVIVAGPVYAAPPPVYYAPPPPVYYAPPPVYYAPPLVSFGVNIR
jgi:hypothetical protein